MVDQEDNILGDGYVSSVVDHRGLPAEKSSTGGWRSAWFIIGVEVAERFACFGIGSNLMNYLTGQLGQSTSLAAANVNAWVGTGAILPIFGAFFADAYLGRFRTILVSSLVYSMGMALLTLSAFLNTGIKSEDHSTEVSTSWSTLVNVLFFFSLYVVAVGQSGHKPCVQAFGADQFDEDDPEENRARSSFFNWWYLSLSAGINLAILVIVYVQDNFGWALGFGIPCVVMLSSLVIFVLGRKTYRYTRRGDKKDNAFARVSRVLLAAFKNGGHDLTEMEAGLSQTRSERLGFLKKALLSSHDSVKGEEPRCTTDLEDAMALIRLMPIWLTTLTFAIPSAQFTTMFTRQGVTMDRQIVSGLEIPPASLQILIGLSIIVLVPFYDRVFVRIASSVTKEPSGITMLQRIGTGMVISTLTMAVAALVESKRLETAEEHGLIDDPNTTVPMSIQWLAPQYLLLGLADVFTLIGMQEFFYSQVPTELRSVGLGLYSSALGVGSFLSSVMISAIDKVTRGAGEGWFDSNLNRAHLDYFYWSLAALSAVGFIAFMFSSRSYVYQHRYGA